MFLCAREHCTSVSRIVLSSESIVFSPWENSTTIPVCAFALFLVIGSFLRVKPFSVRENISPMWVFVQKYHWHNNYIRLHVSRAKQSHLWCNGKNTGLIMQRLRYRKAFLLYHVFFLVRITSKLFVNINYQTLKATWLSVPKRSAKCMDVFAINNLTKAEMLNTHLNAVIDCITHVCVVVSVGYSIWSDTYSSCLVTEEGCCVAVCNVKRTGPRTEPCGTSHCNSPWCVVSNIHIRIFTVTKTRTFPFSCFPSLVSEW